MTSRTDEAGLRAAADEIIGALAGPGATVRDDQLDAARALVVDGRRALVVQATGWGKSAVYWIAARAVRQCGGGPVLVVSPLLSLMRDQVSAAARAGLTAVTLNSSNIDEWSVIERDIHADRVDVLLVSPERLANPKFAGAILDTLVPRLGLLVIDEAHCISSWGHDFRPDYQRIAQLLLANPTLPVLATTATANARVAADVADQLGADTYVQRGQLARTSLHLSVVPGLSQIEAYAWVSDALTSLPGSGIVYVLTVAEATRLDEYLRTAGHVTRAYHGQLDDTARQEIEGALRANDVKAVVATSALGMGYDKPDVAFCVHVGSPASPVDYYQQVGRAGRALDTAVVVLLPGPADERIWEYFATTNVPRPEEAAAVLAALAAAPGSVSIPYLESETGIRRSRVELLLKVLAVEGAVDRTLDGWEGTGRPWEYNHDRYDELIRARRAEAGLMRSYAKERECLEALLRRSLDDDIAADFTCGRCSVCTGALPAGLRAQPSDEAVLQATTFLRSRDVVVEPRKMWTRGLEGLRGTIAPAHRVSEGRALAFADDPAWSEAVRLVADGAPDATCPRWVVEACTEVLARWSRSWLDRPAAVVAIPSSTRPLLISSLAAALAQVGRLELIEVLELHGPAPDRGLSAADRVVQLQPRIGLRSGADLQGRVVLLLDDVVRTRWTMTLAGSLLRGAGATAVLPLAIQQRPD